MAKPGRNPFVVVGGLACGAVAVVVAVVAVTVHARRNRSQDGAPRPPAIAAAAPSPAPAPTTRPAAPQAKYAASYMDVVRAAYPSLPTTQPLAFPLELNQSARLTLHDPVYLGAARGDLWITRADAPPIRQVLKQAVDPNAADPQTHVLRERVAFVHWMPDDSGTWLPYVVCKTGDGYEVISAEHGTQPIPRDRDYRWDRAFSWNEKVVVPSGTGISVFTFSPTVTESYHELVDSKQPKADFSQPLALLDWQGLIAWMPWGPGKTGSRGAARYLDGKWTDFGPDRDWPEKIVHLVPLLDGSVIQFVLRGDATTGVQMGTLDRAPVDEKKIADLVAQLSDVDQEVRQKAYQEITRYGPGAWPVLEKLSGDQPPQAQLLLRELLKDKQRPTLSGMALVGRKSLRLVSRLSDGGAVFYADQGVVMPGADGEPETTAPAWLSIRPGDYVRLLSPMMVVDLKPDTARFDAVGDQWVLTTDSRGPRLFFGNGFATLLRKDERQFDRVIGMDSRGRWLFGKSAEGLSPATQPGGAPTLIIDPHLPDLVPRLPVWQLAIAETVGWDKDNWPVIKRGGAFALQDSDWRALSPDEKVFTRTDEIPPPPPLAPAATRPTTRAASRRDSDGLSRAATREAEPSLPILVAPDGTRYYGGQTDLIVRRPDGRQITWPLPGDCVGSGRAWLVQAKDGKLFLFNQPGRVLRLAPTPTGPQPFKREATFTHDIPNADHPTRIWLDRAGRIDIIWGDRLAVCFPQGFIPRAISQKMVGESGLDADEP